MTTYYCIVHFNHDNDENAKINFSDAFWGCCEYYLHSSDLDKSRCLISDQST